MFRKITVLGFALVLAVLAGGCALTQSGIEKSVDQALQPQSKFTGLAANGHQKTGLSINDLSAAVAARVPEFGGLFLNENGELAVYLTETTQPKVQATEAAIREIFGSEVPDRIGQVLQGKYSFTQLYEWFNRLVALLGEPQLGATMADIDDTKNMLTLGLADLEALALVGPHLDRLGIPREAVNVIQAGPFEPLQHRQETVRPLQGGIHINFVFGPDPNRPGAPGPSFCTLGFIAESVAAGQGFVTNSHCTTVQGGVTPTSYFQGPAIFALNNAANFIGIEVLDPVWLPGLPGCPAGRLCRQSDSAFVRLLQPLNPDRRQLGHIARDADGVVNDGLNPPAPGSVANLDAIVSTWRIVAKDLVQVAGERACKAGARTDTSCGTIVAVGAAINQAGTPFTTLNTNIVVGAPPMVAGGDSGSPVFQNAAAPGSDPDPTNPDVQLAGILWGGSGNVFVYNPLAAVEADLGLLSRVCDPVFGC